MAKNIDKQTEELYQKLREALNDFRDGERFSSFVDIQKKYDCSRRVLECVLKRLSAEKRLCVLPRKGIFAAQKTKDSCRVLLVHIDWAQEYQQYLDDAFIAGLSTLPGVTVECKLVSPLAKIEDYCRILTPENGDIGIVCCNFSFTRKQEDAAKLLNCKIPLIFTENHLVCRVVNLIDSMPEYSGMLAADHLYKRGHRKIALINADYPDACLRREIDGFVCYLALQGITPEVIDCRHPNCESSLASAEEKTLRYLEKNGLNFTAAFVLSIFSAKGVYNALEQLGISVPDDVSIIANSEVPSAAQTDPPMTTVSRDFKGYVETAKKMVTMIREGKQPGIIPVPSFIVERQSVRNINHIK